jgi:hypothetical protein
MITPIDRKEFRRSGAITAAVLSASGSVPSSNHAQRRRLSLALLVTDSSPPNGSTNDASPRND